MTLREEEALERSLPSGCWHLGIYQAIACLILERTVTMDEMREFFRAYYAKHRDPNMPTIGDIVRSTETPFARPTYKDYTR